MLFRDRGDAGHRLAERLAGLELHDPVVLALPRGGVPVAAPVAAKLGAPLDVLVARKLGAPGHTEFGIGAIAEGSDEVVTSDAAARVGVSPEQMDSLAAAEREELERRVRRYRGDAPLPELRDRDVLLVDDGLATGVTAEAGLRSLRAQGPRRLILAIPVCAPDTALRLGALADEVVCLECPPDFGAVGYWYDVFDQTSDDEVVALLEQGRQPRSPNPGPAGDERTVTIRVSGIGELTGDLTVPDDAGAIVLFAHGSGSSRRSPRNRDVAEQLRERGLATMLIDLLTPEEGRADDLHRHLRFDIGLLAERLEAVTDWLAEEPSTKALSLGYFGASTGAAAALVAAAHLPDRVAAVVSRGGRPDLAGDSLPAVEAPTLLIVGGRDDVVLELNREAQARLGGPSDLEVVPEATHLFEEPGALDRVSELAGEWFTRHLAG